MDINLVKQAPSVRRQRGLVLVLVTLSMIALVGFAALAIDINHALLNRARLQSAVDSAALAAASIADELNDTTKATAAAKEALTAIENAIGNGELDFNQGSYSFTYTNDPEVFPDNSFSLNEDIYVRVAVTQYSLANYFLQFFGIAKQVSASAVAGPSAASTQVCNVVPMAVCNNGGSANDGWGYGSGSVVALKLPDSSTSPMGPGNYQLLDFGSGGADVRSYLAGNYEGCVDTNGDVLTKPGNTVGPVGQGLNTRFGDYAAGLGRQSFPPDIYLGEPSPNISTDNSGTIINPSGWGSADYESGSAACIDGGTTSCGTNGVAGRRTLAVPVIDCANPSGGVNEFPVDGVGCFLLLQKAPTNNGGKQHVFGEFLRDCTAENSYNDGSSSSDGPYKIVLYEDPLNEDS